MTKVLVGCEVSGTIRDAFIRLGHDAVSCDLQPTTSPGPHYQGDIFDLYQEHFDLAIFNPPCTYLAVAGAKHLYKEGWLGMPERDVERWDNLRRGAEFFKRCLEWPAIRVACENPLMNGHAVKLIGRKAAQWIQPWQFGHPENKMTGLWLRRLPLLKATNNVKSEMARLPVHVQNRIHYMSPGEDRGMLRSITYKGIAEAMAIQWGRLL